MTNIDDRIAQLSPAKRALLERRLQQSGDVSIPKRGTHGPAAASFAQQRLWFLEQLEPGSAQYNALRVARLCGPFDVAALRVAAEQLIVRHESLRTSFIRRAGQPFSEIAEHVTVPLEVCGVDVSPELRPGEIERRGRALAARPFDLAQAPLFRLTVLRFDEFDHALLLAMHHIITDRWSMGVFERELGELYAAATEGRAAALPGLPIEYSDFAVWQREWLSGATLERQLSFWRDYLAAPIPLLDLPTDRPAGAAISSRGARLGKALPPGLGAQIEALAHRENATPFMVLLAAFQTLLHRYSGQDDIIVGSPVANRNRTELEGLIGFFVNTLVLRTDLSGDPSFSELLGRVRHAALGAFDHQDVPFEKLVEELRPARSLDTTPFFRAMFVLQNAPGAQLAFPGAVVEPVAVDGATAKFDLTLEIEQHAGRFHCSIEYKTDLFDAATITRMLGHFETLLQSIVARPDERVAALPMLTAQELRAAIVDWNATAREFPRNRTVHELVEAQAARSPDARAVSIGDSSLSYRELNERANQLARRLREAGVGPGVCVATCFERSLEMLVGFLAILKAGGAYVPLDPSYPVERLRFMLADTQAPVVLTHSAAVGNLPESAAGVLCLDAAAAELARLDAESLEPRALPEDLAYVIYTSGSTGVPKGVCVPHRAVCRLIGNPSYVEFGAGDVVAQCSNPSFDVSVFEIWGALAHGAGLLLVPKERLLAPSELTAYFAHHGVTLACLTPALFSAIAERRPDAFRALRALFVGGDVMDPAASRAVLAACPPDRLVNGYGPTEVTSWATTYDVTDVPAGAASIPIGRPIDNTDAYVLDRNAQLLPVGVPGELYLGGEGLAWGYLNRPELTAERFVSHPFRGGGTERLYRTGDLVRYREDGTLDFLGRIDNQVKVRGYRIELGEVEAALAAHPAVRGAVVVARGVSATDRRLVAYVTTHAAAKYDASGLREFLLGKLPEYMVPSLFMRLDEFPLSPNGKVDRAALPEAAAAAGAGTREEAANPLEVQLSAIWEELLDCGEIGRHDDFFELGGHSLLAIELMERIERVVDVDMPIRVLFERPTIAGLAQALATGGAPVTAARHFAVRPDGAHAPFFLFHGYFNGGLYTINLSRHLGPDQPFYALHPHASDGVDEEIPATVEAMAEDHLAVIRSISPHGPYYLGGFCNGAMIAYEVARRLRAAGEHVAFLGVFTSAGPNRSSLVRRFAARIARARNLSARAEVDVFLRLRGYARMLGSLSAIRERIVERFNSKPRPESRDAANGAADAGAAIAPDAGPPVQPESPELDERGYRYVDILSRYTPGPFDGEIVLFWANEVKRPASDATVGWRRFARRVIVEEIPGGANTSLTHYPQAVAAKLSAALSRARREQVST